MSWTGQGWKSGTGAPLKERLTDGFSGFNSGNVGYSAGLLPIGLELAPKVFYWKSVPR